MLFKVYFKTLRFIFHRCIDMNVDSQVYCLKQKQRSCYLKSVHFNPLLKHLSYARISESQIIKVKRYTVHPALTGKNDSLGSGLVSRSCSYSSESSHPSTIGNRLSSCTRSKCFHLHLWACIKHEARVSPGSFINSLAHATLSSESCSLKHKLIIVNRNTCFPQPHRRHPASKISSPSFPIPPTFLIS